MDGYKESDMTENVMEDVITGRCISIFDGLAICTLLGGDGEGVVKEALTKAMPLLV